MRPSGRGRWLAQPPGRSHRWMAVTGLRSGTELGLQAALQGSLVLVLPPDARSGAGVADGAGLDEGSERQRMIATAEEAVDLHLSSAGDRRDGHVSHAAATDLSGARNQSPLRRVAAFDRHAGQTAPPIGGSSMARSYHGPTPRSARRADAPGAVSSIHVQARQQAGAVGRGCRSPGAVRKARPATRVGVPVPRAGGCARGVRAAGDRRAPLLRLRRAGAALRGAAAERLPPARLRQLPALPAGRARHPDRGAGGAAPGTAEGRAAAATSAAARSPRTGAGSGSGSSSCSCSSWWSAGWAPSSSSAASRWPSCRLPPPSPRWRPARPRRPRRRRCPRSSSPPRTRPRSPATSSSATR